MFKLAPTLRRLNALRSATLLTSYQNTFGCNALATSCAFRAHRYKKARRWSLPRLSLRRQTELVVAAYATGQLDAVPDCPKKSVILERIRLAEQEAAAAAAAASSPSSPSATSSSASPSSALASTSPASAHFQTTCSTTPLSPSVFEPIPSPASGLRHFTAAEVELMQRSIICQLTQKKGPHMGKKNKFRRNSGLRTVFKGTRQERESAGKKRAIEENMVEMDDRVAEWRQDNAAVRAKAKPSQPF